MRKKVIFGLAFLLLISAVGMAIGRISVLSADQVKSFYKEDKDEEKPGDLTKEKVIDYIPRWRALDGDPDEARGQKVFVLKWGKEIIRDNMGVIEFLRKSARTPFPYILLLLVALMFRFYKRKKRNKNRLVDSYVLNKEGRNLERSSSKDEEGKVELDADINQIREEVRKWESVLPFYKKKRPHETIHEWFERIDGPEEIISIYEKVRYGGKDSSEEELILLKSALAKRG
jgi:hypothetical protein